MRERIYGREFDQDPNTPKPNASIRFLGANSVVVGFSRQIESDGNSIRIRNNHTIRENGETFEVFQALHEEDSNLLPSVLQDLQDIRNDNPLTLRQGRVLDYVINGLNNLVHPIESPEQDEFSQSPRLIDSAEPTNLLYLNPREKDNK